MFMLMDIVYSSKLHKFTKLNQLKQFIQSVMRPVSHATLDLLLSNCDHIKESGSLDIDIHDPLPIFLYREKM